MSKNGLGAIFVFFIFFYYNEAKSQNVTISGYVRDAISKEVVIGAKIYLPELERGTSTNAQGFYNIQVPQNAISLKFIVTSIGFKSLQKEVSVIHNQRMDFELQVLFTKDVEVVYVDTNQFTDPEIGVISIPISRLKSIPNLGGEPDVIKAFQMMPGVQGGKEGSSGLFVRGGTPDQNLFLLDNVPLYYVNHIGGFISTFDPNAINSIKLYKGSFPARYAGRLSSVVDIRMKDGNMSSHVGEFAIGLLSSKLNFEGPMGKDSSMSYFISLRRFNLDLLTRPFARLTSNFENSAGYTFYDINGKLTKRFSDGSKLSLSVYEGRDRIFLNSSRKSLDANDRAYRFRSNVRWGNFMTTLNYSKPLRKRLFLLASLSTTNFKYSSVVRGKFSDPGQNELTNSSSISFASGINDIISNAQLEFDVNEFYDVKAGLSATYHRFSPGNIVYNTSGDQTNVGSGSIHAFEGNAFIENHIRIGSRISINAGLQMNSFVLRDTTFNSLQPRLMLTIELAKKLNLQLGYSKMNQNLHYLANSGLGLPSDLWLPATKTFIPEVANQFNLGLTYVLRKSKTPLNFVLEAFYKDMKNLVEFKDGVSLFSPSSIEDKIVSGGIGTVYGIEFLLQKSVGKLTGWVGYTWSKNTRQFDQLNNGNPYPFIYDRRHDFSLVLSFQIKENVQLNLSWVYMTGNAITLAAGEYAANYILYPETNILIDATFFSAHIYDGKNGFRMPAFHKLDIGANFTKRKPKGMRTLSLGVYNIYNQPNPFLLFFRPNSAGDVTLHQLTLFPIIPSLSYSFVFDTKLMFKKN
jgi:hypothetical protein